LVRVHTFGRLLTVVLTLLAAAVIGFGIPLLWVWIGSQVQGGTGATNVDFSVAMIVLFGIILTYVVLLYLAGWVMARSGHGDLGKPSGTARNPWMRGMTDTRQRHGAPGAGLGGIELLFVVATVLVTAAFWVWFLFLAGSPLPSQ
jgi:hypothetical protein